MYNQSFYVFEGDKPRLARIRNYSRDDFQSLIQIQREAFPPPFPEELLWNEQQLSNHVDLFPEGALLVEVEGDIAGSVTGLRVSLSDEEMHHRWEDITDAGYIRNHDPNGETLYIVDLCVRPKYRGLGLGKCLLQAMYATVIHLGLRRLLGGGRMPGYHKYADSMTAKEYLDSVIRGDIKDPVITFMLRSGRTPVGVVENYLDDEESRNYAALMEWKNPFVGS
jgi:ribosomal protein S18 acetylase RimI-like enzyme